MNLVFDVGNVLLSFQPQHFLGDLFHNRETEQKLMEVALGSPEWRQLDMGTITLEEATEVFVSRCPGLEGEIRKLMKEWLGYMTPIEETIPWLERLSAQYPLYYLSNMPLQAADWITAQYDFWKHFRDGMFSYTTGFAKPDPDIYRVFLERMGLVAGDCTFFDDLPENVEAACTAGMKGVLFTGPEVLERFLSAK